MINIETIFKLELGEVISPVFETQVNLMDESAIEELSFANVVQSTKLKQYLDEEIIFLKNLSFNLMEELKWIMIQGRTSLPLWWILTLKTVKRQSSLWNTPSSTSVMSFSGENLNRFLQVMTLSFNTSSLRNMT